MVAGGLSRLKEVWLQGMEREVRSDTAQWVGAGSQRAGGPEDGRLAKGIWHVSVP